MLRVVGRATLVVVSCLGVAACASDTPDWEPSAEVAQRCGRLGGPVTAAKLVEVFRAHGVTLEVNQWECERSGFTEVGATNMGPSGLESEDDVERREGSVLCSLAYTPGRESLVDSVKFPTDTETHLGVRNVSCSLYPSDPARESAQVERVAEALRAVARAVPEIPAAEWCGSRGAPVTIDDVADILRDNGIWAMRVNQAKCENPTSDLPDVTNRNRATKKYAGIVSCWVGVQEDPYADLEPGEERDPAITIREVNGETSMTVLNVRCTIDPTEKDAAREIAELKAAMELL